MEVQKCYYASFNVGNVEVWSTELYLDRESVFFEIDESKEEIAAHIDTFSPFISEEEIKKILKYAILNLKKFGIYKDKENNFDFFILEQPIWKNYEQKNKINYGTN